MHPYWIKATKMNIPKRTSQPNGEPLAQTAKLSSRTPQITAPEPPIIPAPLDGKRHIPMFAKINPGGNLGDVTFRLNNMKISTYRPVVKIAGR